MLCQVKRRKQFGIREFVFGVFVLTFCDMTLQAYLKSLS